MRDPAGVGDAAALCVTTLLAERDGEMLGEDVELVEVTALGLTRADEDKDGLELALRESRVLPVLLIEMAGEREGDGEAVVDGDVIKLCVVRPDADAGDEADAERLVRGLCVAHAELVVV